jgi:hypothetical protein
MPRWNPGHNAMNTVHSDDVAGGLWAAAEWMSHVGHEEALKLAGQEIFWKNDRSKLTEVTGMPPPEKKIVVPLFNLVSIIISIGESKADSIRRMITGRRLTRPERL